MGVCDREVETYPVISPNDFEGSDVRMVADLPSGPLDPERKKATFDWKLMRINVEDPMYLRIKLYVWSFLESEPLFHSPPIIVSSEEEKRITAKQLVRIRESGILSAVNRIPYEKRLVYLMAVNEAIQVVNPCVSVKIALGISLFSVCVLNLGTERHHHFIQNLWQNEILSCMAITEVAHGSDTKNLQTTATFNPETQEFIINTPNFKAAKCWVGNLGRQCTHALVFAQLISEGQSHGLHVFLVPIRDPRTLAPFSGIEVGDMGDKAGLNGIDNGFIIFRNYAIPKEYLLNRTGDIAANGDYESVFQNPQQILGAALETLSAGRVGIMQESVCTLSSAVVIAIRYAGVRTQFFDKNHKEIPLLDYQLHQWRLLPHLAAAYAQRAFVRKFAQMYVDCVLFSSNSNEDNIKEVSQMVSAVHAIVCSCKALLTWTCRDAVQESREACGGHGYHKAARLGDLRDSHDPTVTYEGANHVLLQQTSRWLIRLADEAADLNLSHNRFPSEEIKFIQNFPENVSTSYNVTSLAEILDLNFISKAYQWLISWLLFTTKNKFDSCLKSGQDAFAAKNNVQVFYAQSLSLAFAENIVLNYFESSILSADSSLQPVLVKLHLLYGLTCIQRHIRFFYEGGFATSGLFSELISNGILELCRLLRPDAVALADALAPPDFALNSVLGFSDGNVYDHLEQAFSQHPGAYGRPTWWKDIALKSKL